MDDEHHRRDFIGHLFALVTANLEDAATLAVEGQGAALDQIPRLTAEIRKHLEAALVLIEAIRII